MSEDNENTEHEVLPYPRTTGRGNTWAEDSKDEYWGVPSLRP
jgi:hypothetical protein